MTKFEVYENGYWNGVSFGYIPNLNKDEMQLWAIGYKDGKNNTRKSFDEITKL